MMKSEFEKKLSERTGKQVSISNEDYSKIEYVYTWHPSLDPVHGKDQIARLYDEFGMRIIIDMMETAAEAESLDNDMNELLHKQAELRAKMDCLKRGVKYDPAS